MSCKTNGPLVDVICREQLQCLRRGLELLAVGGKLMYTTSSYNPVENEAVVLHMLKECEGIFLFTVLRVHIEFKVTSF